MRRYARFTSASSSACSGNLSRRSLCTGARQAAKSRALARAGTVKHADGGAGLFQELEITSKFHAKWLPC